MKGKRTLIVGVTLLVLAFLLTLAFAAPAFAVRITNSSPRPAVQDNDTNWKAMHEACEAGDYNAMLESMKAVHGDDYQQMLDHMKKAHGGNDMHGKGGSSGMMNMMRGATGGMMGGMMRRY